MTAERIVIVEDNPDSAELLSRNIQRINFNVKPKDILVLQGSENFAESISLTNMPSMIIISLGLSGGKEDGRSLLKKLKNDDSPFKEIPVVIYSGFADEDTITECLELGADAFIPKTTTPEKTRSILKELIKEGSND